MRLPGHRLRAWVTAVLATAVALALVALPPQSTPAPLVPAAAAAPGVEDDGADCPVPPPGSTASRAELPDPFLRANGARVPTREDWRCRRAEIREPAERHVYGDKPARPDGVTGTVSRTGITVQASHQGRSAGFTAGVELPSGNGPFPAVVVLGGLGADTAAIKNAGAAVVSPDPYALGREGASRSAPPSRAPSTPSTAPPAPPDC
ncbi:hypothetical protein [Streptomyces sp. enrichment culture]|uniref:hypothetical protein n=1 Tax=Streptomyces sp. enrichment culture TaxID=1795815 RepID=UPI003F566D9C